MTQICIIYSMCIMNFILIGISDAAGRSPLIFKNKYYLKAIVHSIVIGHLLLIVVALYSWGLWMYVSDSQRLWDSFLLACSIPIQIFVIYISVVLFTFTLYSIPNSEVRSLVTVASFGPLTIIKSPIVITGWFVFVSVTSDWRLISIWTLGTLVILSQKALLNFLGFARNLARSYYSVVG